MLTSDKDVVQLVVDQCKLHGVKTIVFSPGSRNSPLSIAFDEDDFFQTIVIHDERSAAFCALGIAQEKNASVALCCTSGSALLNYYPAISEAFYRNLPLLILSADRPAAWIDQGDGQTIRQQHIFEQHTHGFFQLEDIHLSDDTLWYYQRETSILLHKLSNGPVHFNIALKEPLYNVVEKKSDFGKKISFFHSSSKLQLDNFQIIKSKLYGKKIMVICGQMNINNPLAQRLAHFAKNTGAVVLAENISNLYDPHFISCVERVFHIIETDQDYLPEVVIHLGGAIVSKRVKVFLRNIENLEVIRLSEDTLIQDTFKHLTVQVSIAAIDFFDQFKDFQSQSSVNFFGKWKQLDIMAQDKVPIVAESLKGLNDLYAFYLIHQYVPEYTVIHSGNSSVVRYMQLFDMVKGSIYYANRGTSGIDGSFSTAVGAAMASPSKNHLFVCGDIAFIYDHNALWIENFPPNLKVIIINNAGGGIFRIIDGAKDSSKSSRYFEANHTQDVSSLVSAFSKSALNVSSFEHLELHIKEFLSVSNNEFQFLEIITDSEMNPHILSNFYKGIK